MPRKMQALVYCTCLPYLAVQYLLGRDRAQPRECRAMRTVVVSASRYQGFLPACKGSCIDATAPGMTSTSDRSNMRENFVYTTALILRAMEQDLWGYKCDLTQKELINAPGYICNYRVIVINRHPFSRQIIPRILCVGR
ncbi:hypothetical protein F5X98DRAFT_216920 [Xylaria grammica]|nr:hypothetical protein F5X98DRAFT_216920 [Xylaria grammica]